MGAQLTRADGRLITRSSRINRPSVQTFKMFSGLSAWFSTSCDSAVIKLWNEQGGDIVNEESAEFVFSEDANTPDTRNLHQSEAYAAGELVIFKTEWIKLAIDVGNRHLVSPGPFVLSPVEYEPLLGELTDKREMYLRTPVEVECIAEVQQENAVSESCSLETSDSRNEGLEMPNLRETEICTETETETGGSGDIETRKFISRQPIGRGNSEIEIFKGRRHTERMGSPRGCGAESMMVKSRKRKAERIEDKTRGNRQIRVNESTSSKTLAMVLAEEGYGTLTEENIGPTSHQTAVSESSCSESSDSRQEKSEMEMSCTETEVVGNRETEILGRQVWRMGNQGKGICERSMNMKSRKREAKRIEKTSDKTLAMVLAEKLTEEQIGSTSHQTDKSRKSEAKRIEKTSDKTLAMVLAEKGYGTLTEDQIGSTSHQTDQACNDHTLRESVEQEKEDLHDVQGVIHVRGLSLSRMKKKLREFKPNVDGCYVTLKTI